MPKIHLAEQDFAALAQACNGARSEAQMRLQSGDLTTGEIVKERFRTKSLRGYSLAQLKAIRNWLFAQYAGDPKWTTLRQPVTGLMKAFLVERLEALVCSCTTAPRTAKTPAQTAVATYTPPRQQALPAPNNVVPRAPVPVQRPAPAAAADPSRQSHPAATTEIAPQLQKDLLNMLAKTEESTRRVVQVLQAAHHRVNDDVHRHYFEVQFTMTQEILDQLADPATDWKVKVYICSSNDLTYNRGFQADRFVLQNAVVRINGKKYHHMGYAGNRFFYITAHLVRTAGAVNKFYVDVHTGYFPKSNFTMVVMERSQTDEELMARAYEALLKKKNLEVPKDMEGKLGLLREHLLQLLPTLVASNTPTDTASPPNSTTDDDSNNQNKEEEEDLVIGDQSLMFQCPLSMIRMVHPVKGPACTHLQCFDMQSFLMVYGKTPHWTSQVPKCPNCDTALAVDQLQVDPFTLKMLQDFPNAEGVIVHPDGSVTEKRDQGESQDLTATAATGNPAKRKREDGTEQQEETDDVIVVRGGAPKRRTTIKSPTESTTSFGIGDGDEENWDDYDEEEANFNLVDRDEQGREIIWID